VKTRWAECVACRVYGVECVACRVYVKNAYKMLIGRPEGKIVSVKGRVI